MRERNSGRRMRLQVALAGALVLSMASGVAFAQNAQDDDEAFDAKFWQGFMRELGLQREGPQIEYRERSPLVVPPSRALPPPRNEAAVTANPAWPNDPDAASRRREPTTAPSAKARLRGDRLMEDLRPLRPNEIAAGQGPTSPAGGPTNGATVEDMQRTMRPSELGSKKNLWETLTTGMGPEKPESVQFQGEAPRTALTAPPSGYQTPSPAQPYGLSPSKGTAYKPSTLEDRTPAGPR